MNEIYNALGWQGGTVHQIVREIENMKKEIDLHNVIRNGIKHMADNGEFKLRKESTAVNYNAIKIIYQKIDDLRQE